MEGTDDESSRPAPRVLSMVAHVLERLVSRNELVAAAAEYRPAAGRGLEGFCGSRAPSIGIGSYLERIHRLAGCSPSCFVVGFAFIDRAAHRRPGSMVASLNVHRLILTSVLVASKVLDDTHQNNAFYARVGGVSNLELNRLELELLFLLDFEVTLSLRTFESYCLHLEKETMMCDGGAAHMKIERPIIPADGSRQLHRSADNIQKIGTSLPTTATPA
ncbi:putative cyclin-P1-1 [Iris pallida]|uniref:Cyclin n=1 Tax=Iris pallida TaxID=29817 RepID=A0AAX6IJ70_IRIPA|nr:putative cyclin-P1-1 [Iris pallida]